MLQEVCRTRIEGSFHAEESASKGIFVFFRNVRNLVDVLNALSYFLNLFVLAVYGGRLDWHFVDRILIVNLLFEFFGNDFHEFLLVRYVVFLDAQSHECFIEFKHFLAAKLQVYNGNQMQQH
jgi:hypothetical protein